MVRERAPQALLVAGIAGVTALVYPAEPGSKLRAWLTVVVIAALISLVPTGKRKEKLTVREIASGLAVRAVSTFPSIETIDPARPLLAVQLSDSKKMQVFMLVAQVPLCRDSSFYIRPLDSKVLAGELVEVADGVSALRQRLSARGLRFIPQSSYTDTAAQRLFGENAHLEG